MLSIIIPVLNEAESIPLLLGHLTENATLANIAEIIVVDGGSVDGTQNFVKDFAHTSNFNVRLIPSEKGRAKQMNVGADFANGAVLYFLHADSFPPKGFDRMILSEVKKGNPAGCFKMKFDSNHWWLRLASWFTKFNWRACRGGDQSQFISRKLFNEIGGFDESYVIYEDNILINELYARKKFVVIQEWLSTSARLYHEKGIWRLQYHFCAIYVKQWLGADANTLYAYYKNHIQKNSIRTHSVAKVTPKIMGDK